ncbi:hypothetical protein [Pelagibius marinus]|uniref:hypothetical protein n=1 Tax=Pelagibius marinus TaxID=2762760 RepID=UPI001872E78D|nr:hypothetical protein [Pelagibius marinus]
MAKRYRSLFLALTCAGVLTAAPLLPAAQAAVSQEAAAKSIAERYGVQVLKVRAGERDGRKVWLVTVMQPGGNSNGAFQVHLLAVDQESGNLVSSFQHGVSGYTLPPLPPGGER